MFNNPEKKLKDYAGLMCACGAIIAIVCLMGGILFSGSRGIGPVMFLIGLVVAAIAFCSFFVTALLLHVFADMLESLKAIEKNASDICGTQKGMYKTQKGMFQYQLKSDRED